MYILVLYLVCHSPVSRHLGQIFPRSVFSFNGILWSIKYFTFGEAQFICFSFSDHAFGVIPQNLRSQRITSLFSSKSFIISALRSLIHLELIFVCSLRQELHFFCMWIHSCATSICWKGYSVHIKWFWCSCWKSVDHRYMGLFLDFQFFWLFHMSVLCQYSTILIKIVLY